MLKANIIPSTEKTGPKLLNCHLISSGEWSQSWWLNVGKDLVDTNPLRVFLLLLVEKQNNV